MIKKIIVILSIVLFPVWGEIKASQEPFMLPIGALVSLANSKPTYYLDSRFEIAINPESKTRYSNEVLTNLKMKLITLLESKYVEELTSTKGKKSLQKELIKIFSKELKYSEIIDVYITKFRIDSPFKQNSKKIKIQKKEILSSKTNSEKSLHVKQYLQKTKKIDIESEKFQQALFDAEEMTKLEPNKSENWLYYGTLLLYLQDVQDAQISAEVAAKIALSLNPKDESKAYMVLLQSYINQFDFNSAILTMKEMLDKEPILINHLPLADTFVSIHTFSGDIENGIGYLDDLLLKRPSSYGAIVANIKLQKQDLKESLYKNEVRNNIVQLKKDLNFIYKKSKHKIAPDMRQTIKSILEVS